MLTTLARYAAVCPPMESHFALCFQGRSSQELVDANAVVHDLRPVRTRYPWTIWQSRRKLQEVLRANHFDIAMMHMSWPHAVFGSVLTAAGIPIVHWAHGPYSNPTDWVDRWAMRYTPAGIIANSQYTAKLVAGLFPDVDSKVISYPLPLSRRDQQANVRAAIRRELGVPSDSTVIVQVSRMDPWKGHTMHLEALARLRHVPAWECWFIGGAQRPEERKYEHELSARAAILGIRDRVKFLGQKTNVGDYLEAADIFCQPNALPEPYGIVYIEALQAGLPVVASAIGGALEIIDSSCGCLVPPGDSVALSDLLSTLIASPSLRLGLARNGPARASELCDPAVQMNRIHDYLRRNRTLGLAKTSSQRHHVE